MQKREVSITQVDSFTSEPFKGNPAGVCLAKSPLKEDFMQNLAMEINLSETAFLWPEKDGYRLRWFTPTVEVALCGHATLAAAQVLWEQCHLPKNRSAKFYTKSGLLTAYKDGKKIALDFPAMPAMPCAMPKVMEECFSSKPSYVGKNKQNDLLVVLSDESRVREFVPSLDILKKQNMRGLIITAKSDNLKFDFISRFFAVSVGVDEDPVTGSAHCCLAPYWSTILEKKELVGYQASKRGGFVGCRLTGDRVTLLGEAVSVFSLKILLD